MGIYELYHYKKVGDFIISIVKKFGPSCNACLNHHYDSYMSRDFTYLIGSHDFEPLNVTMDQYGWLPIYNSYLNSY
jgi:hypothetical protein